MRVTCVGIACMLLVGCYGVNGGGGGADASTGIDDERDALMESACTNLIAECPTLLRPYGIETASACKSFYLCVHSIGYGEECLELLDAIGECFNKIDALDCSACDEELRTVTLNCPRPSECLPDGYGGSGLIPQYTAGAGGSGGSGGAPVCTYTGVPEPCYCPNGQTAQYMCQPDGTYSPCPCATAGGTGGAGMGGAAGAGGLSCGMAGSINPCPCPGDPPGSVSGTQICQPDGTYTPCACGMAGFCGDGVVNVDGEQCDGTDLGGMTCGLLGMGTGRLHCYAASCVFDISMCYEEPPAAGTGGSGGSGTLYCCALDLLCTQSPTLEMAPCLLDPAFLDAARNGDESECKRVIDNNDMRVHKYDCSQPGHSQDCWFEEADALAACS